MSNQPHSSYRQIFKSTSLVGGAQIIRLAIGAVQVKALAMLLGPAGVGIAGLYTSAIALIGTISGMGIGSSGVRQIAEAAASEDEDRIARTVDTLRITSLASGLVGMLVGIALCVPLSQATFGSRDYAFGIAIVAVSLLFTAVSAGQMALLQGLRRLRDLAKCNVYGALLGAVASISLVYLFGERGIAWYLVAVSVFAAVGSWWYARKVAVKAIAISWREMAEEARGLLGMGIAFMTSALCTAGSAYLARVLIIRSFDVAAVGLYSATVTLSSLYVGLVLSAMGADFYPRLTGLAKDHVAMNRLVNQQTEMGLLMALPGVLATLVFAPWILTIFYSPAFVEATTIIRWQILGVALRVVCWPMGFILLAKGASRMFMLTELLFNILYVVSIVACMHVWGLDGMGIAFFVMYLIYMPGIMVICHRTTGFLWSRKTLLLIVPSAVAVAATLFCSLKLPPWQAYAAGLLITAGASIACLYFLQRLLDINPWRDVIARLAPRLGQ